MAEILDRQVAASADDCKVAWDGSAWALDLVFTNNPAGYGSSTNYKLGCGMRFLNITIPKGSTINSAYLTFTAALARSNTTVNSKIHGEDVDDAAQFSNYANYSGRTRTSAVVNWNDIAAWSGNVEYNSPDIASIIQEIIDRAGWASGNAMVVFWDDHDDLSTHVDATNRIAYGYDNVPANAPKLHIEYTPPAAGGARSHGYIMG